MSDPLLSNNYKTWDVKLIWLVTYPSRLYSPGDVESASFEIFGVDRSAINITRPKNKIESLEQGGQGWSKKTPSFTIPIFTKESGESFEKLRRLAALDIPFDVQLNLASDVDEQILEDNPHEGIWIDGYEEFLGCTVINERTNYAITEFPVREFECAGLRHFIKETDDFESILEGDGTYRTSWPAK